MCCNSETQNTANEKVLDEVFEPENPVVENSARPITDQHKSPITEEDERLFNEQFPLLRSNKEFVNVILKEILQEIAANLPPFDFNEKLGDAKLKLVQDQKLPNGASYFGFLYS